MSDLMQKLAMSKKIMDKHNEVPRGQDSGLAMVNQNVNAKYNIPSDVLSESTPQQQPKIQDTISTKTVTNDAVLNSKLPDEIKKLMIENPIVQPQMNGATLSNDIIEGAARLMNNGSTNQQLTQETTNTNTSNSDLKQMIRDVVRDTVRDVVKEELTNAGLISEGNQKTNETLSLRVGKHIFEGKVTKIKKVKQ
jgi:hypothetical protein